MPILQNIMCKCAKSFSFWGLRPPNRGFAPGPHWRTSVPEPPDWPVFILGLSGGGNSPSKKIKKNPPKFDETEEPAARIHGWMTLTKMLVPIYLYCLNCTKFGQLILRKIIKIVATRCQTLGLKCIKFDFGWGSNLVHFSLKIL